MVVTHGAPASIARRTAEETLRAWDLIRCADDVLLVITELVQNVTKHTTGDGELHLFRQPDSILIEVTDADPELPRLSRPDPRRLGGRGLLLVAAVALSWGTRNTVWNGRTGKVVWAQLPIPPA